MRIALIACSLALLGIGPSLTAESAEITVCTKAPGARPVTNYGSFVPNRTDAAVANTATINTAIDTVGRLGGGIICLPAGSYYLTNRKNWTLDPTAIGIKYSNITLWGAGKTTTILHTKSTFANHLRGHGIYIAGSSVPPAQHNITLRDFELDGGAGFTGCYDWVGDQPNCWDTTHKGIIVGWDALLDNVTLQDVYVHRYRGELLYTGGMAIGRITVERVTSADSNASTFNLFGAQVLVQDSEFGKARFWMELLARTNDGGYASNQMVFRNNYFHDNNADAGISITQGDGSAMKFVFDHNRFARSPKMLLGLFGGVGGPVQFTNNTISDVGSWIVAFAVTPNSIVPRNANLYFDHNTITRGFGLTYLEYTDIRNVTISNTIFRGLSSSKPSDSESILYGSGAKLYNIHINNNYFQDCRKPRRTGAFSGSTPYFANNTYSNCVN